MRVDEKRILLLTGYDDAMARVGDLTAPLGKQYAEQHGLDFKCVRNYEPGSHPSWQKIRLVSQAFSEGYAACMWLDADTMVTNMMAAPWRQMESGLHVSRDWGEDATTDGHFSMGNFLAFADTLPIWEAADGLDRVWANVRFWEQSAIRELFELDEHSRSMIHVHPRRVFNSVPQEVGRVVDPWQPGDWLCHLTMIPYDQREQLFHHILSVSAEGNRENGTLSDQRHD